MTRNEALHDIIARLNRENVALVNDLERLRRPRTTGNLCEINRIRNRIAMNNDVIRECATQLVLNQAEGPLS